MSNKTENILVKSITVRHDYSANFKIKFRWEGWQVLMSHFDETSCMRSLVKKTYNT